jgi:hypothetical protein
VQTIAEVLSLRTLPGVDEDDDERTAIVEYNLTYWNKSTIKLQVTWKNPYRLSKSGLMYADMLKIKFDLPELFISVNDRSVLPNNTVIGFPVPQQATLEEMAKLQ